MNTKKHLASLMALALTMLTPLGLHAELTQSEGIYQLSSAADLSEFISLVETNPEASAAMTSDIDFSANTTTVFPSFKGTFDGQGHTLTIAYDGDQGAFFPMLEGGTIRRIHLAGSITSTNPKLSGFVLEATNGSIIEYCHISTSITQNSNDYKPEVYFFAGFVAGTTIRGLVYDGDLIKIGYADRAECYGIGKFRYHASDSPTSFHGILSMPGRFEIANNDNYSEYVIIPTFGSTDFLASKNYPRSQTFYTIPEFSNSNMGVDFFTAGNLATPERLQSGEITFALNDNNSDDNVVWRQNIGTDPMPQFMTSSIVYSQSVSCKDIYEGFTNTPSTTTFLGHDLAFIPASDPSALADGTDAYYKCSICNKIFSDAEATDLHTSAEDFIRHYFVDGECTHHTGFYKEPHINEEGWYEITIPNELKYFTTLKNVGQKPNYQRIKLMNDIVFNTGVLEGDTLTSNAEAISSFKTWDNPVFGWYYSFEGIFDGQGHTVSGIYSPNGNPFIKNIMNATVKDLTIADSYFRGENASAFFYTAESSDITNCVNRSCICGTGGSVGALASANIGSKGNTINCVNYGTVTTTQESGTSNTGGLFGTNDGHMDSCYNYGAVRLVAGTASGKVVGGLVGASYGLGASITNCANYGTVVSNGNTTGGLFGGVRGNEETIPAPTITNSHNYADVTGAGETGAGETGASETGGLFGFAYYTEIEQCSNHGNVKSTNEFTGGLFGVVSGCALNQVWNTGAVEGTTYVGGLTGETTITYGDVEFSNSYNTGSVTGDTNVYGIAAYNNGPMSLTSCYTTTDIEGNSNVALISPTFEESQFSTVYSIGDSSLPMFRNNAEGNAANHVQKQSLSNMLNGNLYNSLHSSDDRWSQNVGFELPNLSGKGVYQTRTVAADTEWGTGILPFNVESNDSIAYYTISSFDIDGSGTISVSPTSTVAHNTPFIYRRLNPSGSIVTFAPSAGLEGYEGNHRTVTTPSGIVLHATTVDTTVVSTVSEPVYYIAGDKFYNANVATPVPAFRAWFTLPSASPARQLSIIVSDGPDTDSQATTILTLSPDGTLSPDSVYDLSGSHLAAPRRGQLNIIGGKKVYVGK